jgi:hypothetical protein
MTAKPQLAHARQTFLNWMSVYLDKKETERYKILNNALRLVKRYSQTHRPEERAEFGEFASEWLFRRVRTACARKLQGYLGDVKKTGEALLKISQLTGCSEDYYISTKMLEERVDLEGSFRTFFG